MHYSAHNPNVSLSRRSGSRRWPSAPGPLHSPGLRFSSAPPPNCFPTGLPSEGRCECSGRRGPEWPQLCIEDVPQRRAAGPLTLCPTRRRVPSLGTAGRLCDCQVLGKVLGSPSRGLLSSYWLVEAQTRSPLLAHHRADSLIPEMWGRCFFLILRENPVTHPIKAPRALRTQ